REGGLLLRVLGRARPRGRRPLPRARHPGRRRRARALVRGPRRAPPRREPSPVGASGRVGRLGDRRPRGARPARGRAARGATGALPPCPGGRVPLAGVVWDEAGWRGLTPVGRHPFWTRQERVLLARAGAIDPGDLDDALLHGGYAALAQALDSPPGAVIEQVKASGLQGRGGA